VEMHYFLLIYNHAHRALQTVQTFSDKVEAGRAYVAAERASGGDPNVEVVLVGADSLETIQQTHGQYFRARAGQSKYLDAASAAGAAVPVPAV
jgi:hypothetical protein